MKKHIASTPLVSKPYRTTAQEVFREPVVPKIMPDVSNLKSHSRYGQSKIGRSEPNLTQRLQPLGSNRLGFNQRTNQLMSNRTLAMTANSTLVHSKSPSDSRLLVRNGLRLPQNHNQAQLLGRETSPTPPQSQQQMLKKVIHIWLSLIAIPCINVCLLFMNIYCQLFVLTIGVLCTAGCGWGRV